MRSIAMLAVVALGTATVPAPISAQDKDAPTPPPAVYQAVLDCEKIAEATQRLACFDRAVAALGVAARDREVVVIDRSAMREARRGIFGLSLPRLKLFSDDGESEEVVAIDGTISGVRMAPDGMPIFVLEDGARWKQTEGRNVYPKVGHPIHIRRAAMGSYIANVNKRPGVRVVRMGQ